MQCDIADKLIYIMENNQERIKIEVYQGLPIIQEMIKDLAITREMGESVSWLSSRQKKRMSRNFQFVFTESDVQKLNEALWRIGERLKMLRLEYREVRQENIDQIKEKLSEIYLPYVYLEKMGMKDYWWNARMVRSDAKGTKASFKPEDVLKINLAIAEIAARLLSIELVVE